MKRKLLLSAILISGLNSCGVQPEQNSHVTAVHPVLTEIPADCFSQLSSGERNWFKKFQEGSFFVDGWKDRTEDLLDKTPGSLRDNVAQRMEDLGYRIGCEWSRDNGVRRIDTDDLKSWGNGINRIADDNPTEILNHLNELYINVTEILGAIAE